ncbi:hypothetical protein NZ47_12070 [Anaerovibrio lipolyticus]|uniref:Transglycosylase SLT domain-containing protein n=1 Tax=Anaerovibrio lipolyticus TaxID=82374 RepID=A0A0B2JSG8_9FIRM|nr:hypothetical protein NZ47_12070 [Anaerovibrio lipolyticus]
MAGFLLFAVNYSEAASVEETVYTEVCQFNPNPDQEVWIYQAIMYASAMYSVDPLLLTAVIEQESHFNISAFSPAGAVGLAQLMPSTANSIGVDPYDPLQNVLGGAKHLRTLLNSFDNGNPYGVTNAIAAYNAGSQAVIDNGGCPPYSETVNYVCSIAGIYNNLLSRIY